MTPERRAKLIALGEWHSQWVAGQLPAAPFRPEGRKAGSDYNQHYVDLEADDAAFHERAREIMGIAS